MMRIMRFEEENSMKETHIRCSEENSMKGALMRFLGASKKRLCGLWRKTTEKDVHMQFTEEISIRKGIHKVST